MLEKLLSADDQVLRPVAIDVAGPQRCPELVVVLLAGEDDISLGSEEASNHRAEEHVDTAGTLAVKGRPRRAEDEVGDTVVVEIGGGYGVAELLAEDLAGEGGVGVGLSEFAVQRAQE